ncbi:hypothetical protein [Alkalibacillus haloalkaliphilus]|uniref:Uncharacterized protein n=1 Tax=Alkalibacillus haloalkaliphilus TaxID=94136 RepID=A0A511W6X4_9BACI|nr:hypothetical protein [Alkalibacillus haloalkaliphilus]GEN46058.1 hypothetical protein AHA02nite_18340 [Alkalibacillus haloalkaliphilus]
MGSQQFRCKACDGAGLLMDDEEWRYTCTVCSGDGYVSKYESQQGSRINEVDENNRILD